MILGIGTDIIEINRIKEVGVDRLAHRICTVSEIQSFPKSFQKRVEVVAGRFAAKEAMAKALGVGIGAELSWHDMEIKSDEKGKPFITSPYPYLCHLSISHTKEYAVAQVILESSSS